MRPPVLRAFTLAAALLLASPAAAERQEFGDEAIPARYDIAITPDAAAGTFSGTVRIELETPRPLSALTLNALDLEISRAHIDGRRATATLDASAQTARLATGRTLAPGRHVLDIAYRGKIYDDAYGLFRVTYAAEGAARRMLVTQFEPGDARRFAPMWDQPNRRAVFSLTVTVPAGAQAVSNMPVEAMRQLAGARTRVRFADTPSMPSYLLFLAVGDFDRITTNVDGVELGVVTRRGDSDRGRYALEASAEALRYFTDYFGVPYPLPKLDMIAVPGAGGFGAMENWGAIMYFDNRLLIDAAQSSERDRQDVWATVAHEIAHQWFGNLVTMAWWDDLWLNEGFAEWISSKAMAALHADWSPWLLAADESERAKGIDARLGTHPIVQQVDTLEQANLAFDAITYRKGRAVVRMLEAYVGEAPFRAGVRAYINAHLYGNATTADLWRAVQQTSGAPVIDVARSFTSQVGVPVVRVETAPCRRRDGTTRVTLTQARFAEDDASRTDETWAIPIVVRTLSAGDAEDEERRALMARQGATTIELAGGCRPVLVNSGQTAYMRTLYSQADLARLVARFHGLPVADQLGILQDYWAFGRAGYAPLSAYFEIAQAASSDVDPYVALQIAGALQGLWRMQAGRPEQASFAAFARGVLRPMFDRVGWSAKPGEAVNDGLLRDQLIRTLGRMGDGDVAAEARRRVEGADTRLLPGGVREAALRAYGAQAGREQYDYLLARARGATDFTEQRRLYFSLAEALDPALADRTLEIALGEDVPRQLRPKVIAVVAQAHPRRAWDFIVARRSAVEGLLDPLSRLDFAPEVAANAADPAVAAALEAYAQSFPAESRQAATTAAAEIRARARVVGERASASVAWLAAHAAR